MNVAPLAIGLDSPSQVVSHFWTVAELLAVLPMVVSMRNTFQLFARPSGSKSVDILKVSECLRAMGLHFVESQLKTCLVQRLLGFPQARPPTRVSFELVLSIYCELARAEDMPSAALMINGLRCCDANGSGTLPYAQLRRMLTTVGERLNEAEASALLDSMRDDSGNVNYIALMETMFADDNEITAKIQQASIYLEALGKNAGHMDMDKRDEFILALRHMDPKNSGFIAADRMLKLLNSTGDCFSNAELAALTRNMTNARRQIDYQRLLRLIMNE